MQFPFQLITQRPIDVAGFGTNAVDFLIEVPRYPAFNSKVELLQYTQAAGGEVATTMVGLQRLGLKTRYIGRFGDDPAGDIGYASLTGEGIDLAFAERIRDSTTQIAFIVIDAETGERTVIWKRDPKHAYSAQDAPIVAVADAKVLHLTPHDTDACIELAKAARSGGAIVSTDIDRVFDGIEELLPSVDILLASADFPEALTGITDPKLSLEKLQAIAGSPVVGITLGDSGSLVLGPGGFIETPAFPVPGGCRDTTGAGDSFRAGFLYGVVKGRSIEESCRLANAVASLKCRAVGARTALPSETELLAFL